MKALLEKLKIQEINPGACSGPDGWITDRQGTALVSYNPATGEPIARVVQAAETTYETVVRRATRGVRDLAHCPGPQARAAGARPGRRSARDSRSRWANWSR